MRWLPNSLIDYPGKIAAVLYLPGCNLRCPYCHNPELALASEIIPETPENKKIISDFSGLAITHSRIIDGVVFSGGEPTLHGDDLAGLCRYWKEAGYPVKIDTNGTRPDVLKYLIEKNLVDYVALSLKPELSSELTKKVWCETIPLLKNSGINFEIRIVAVSPKISNIPESDPRIEYFEDYLMECCQILRDDHEIKKLKLHRFNVGQGVLNPAFYDDARMYGESDYHLLADIVRDDGLECEIV